MEAVPEEIGRHFIIGLSGPRISALDSEVLRALKPLGVILRAHNFLADLPYQQWRTGLSELLQQVRALTGRSSAIIAIDHEGGRVHRTPAPLTHFPAARSYAPHAGEVAAAMAIELKSIGVNLSFAPVADIDSNPQNPVIGLRAFGSSAKDVSAAATAFARALLMNGVVPVAKHFPGHGDSSQDSHEELPVLGHSLSDLLQRELLPFQALVANRIPALLTAHLLFPALDSEFPATLSPLILHRLAREELGFEGVIISDDMDMKAIAENFSDEEVALQSFTAGCDVLLFNHDPARALRVARIAEELLNLGSLDVDMFARSSTRITALVDQHVRPYQPSPLSAEVLAAHAQLKDSIAAEDRR